MTQHARTIAGIAAIAVVMIGLWIAYERHSTRSNIVVMVKDSAARLRAGLEAQVTAGELEKSNVDFEANAAAAEAHVAKLRNLNARSFTALTDAADDYLVTTREILRRELEMKRAQASLAVSRETLARHLQSDRGAGDWPKQAVALKETLDKDLRDYKIAVESHASLLDSFPASQSKIASYVDAATLIDEKLIQGAKSRALDAFARADTQARAVASIGAARAR